MNHQFFVSDLKAVAKKLKNKIFYKKFAGCVERYSSICSCKLDLDVAFKSIGIVIDHYIAMEVDEAPQDDMEGLVGGALFLQAVIFYARATDTASNSRRPSGISGKLTSQSRELHTRVMALRNDALAHFGSGGDGWVKEGVALRMREDNVSLFAPWTRYNYRGDMAMELRSLVVEAQVFAAEILTERSRELLDEIKRLFQNDIHFVEIIDTYPFDARSIFSSNSGVEMFERGLEQNDYGSEKQTIMSRSDLRRAGD
jgi:hypothetical protein